MGVSQLRTLFRVDQKSPRRRRREGGQLNLWTRSLGLGLAEVSCLLRMRLRFSRGRQLPHLLRQRALRNLRQRSHHGRGRRTRRLPEPRQLVRNVPCRTRRVAGARILSRDEQRLGSTTFPRLAASGAHPSFNHNAGSDAEPLDMEFNVTPLLSSPTQRQRSSIRCQGC